LNSGVNFLRRSRIDLPPFRAGPYWVRYPESGRLATRREGWLGEVDGLQISLNGARQKLAQLDQIATKTTSTELGMPTFTQIAGRSVPPPDILA
jgi:hypothetical protein